VENLAEFLKFWKKSSKVPKRACAVCLALQWLYAVGGGVMVQAEKGWCEWGEG